MNACLKVVSLSLSGGVLILALLLGRVLWKDQVSKTWQYYIWLIVVARLLLPVPTEIAFVQRDALQDEQSTQVVWPTQAQLALLDDPGETTSGDVAAATEGPAAPEVPRGNVGMWLLDKLWLLWLGVALVLFLHRVVTYRRFAGHLRRDWETVEDPALMGALAQAKAKAGVGWPVALYRNPMVSSPLLLGFFRPVVVLPNTDLSESELHYTLLHELTHCKRGDMFYKWLVQLTLCLHWFNPLVWWMAREINRDGELSCDEALLCRLDAPARRDYGDTLLHAVVTEKNCPKLAGTIYLNESAQCLKERLGVIMKFGKKKRLIVPVLLTCLLIGGAVVAGACVPQTVEKEITEEELWELEHSITWGYAEESLYEVPQHMAWTLQYPQGEETVMVPGNDGQGPYIFVLSCNVHSCGGEPVPSKTFPLWDEEEQERVTLTAYFSKYSEKIMKDPGAMRALREIIRGVYETGKEGGFRNINFFVHVADNVGAVGAETLARQYYEEGVPGFHNIFGLLDEGVRREWLERAYREGDRSLYEQVLNSFYPVDETMDPAVLEELAQRAYADNKVAIFDVWAGYMDREALERWQERLERENRVVYLPIVRESLRRVQG